MIKQQQIANKLLKVSCIPAMLLALTGCITELDVRTHGTVPLSNNQASGILNDFGDVIRIADSASDFACAEDFGPDGEPAFYIRDGGVGNYTGPANINTQANLTASFNAAGYAKAVNAINFCGGFNPNIIGCAPINGQTFIVERFTANQEGILWAHEFGHSVGLPHRDGPTTVMNSFIASDQLEINSTECLSFISLGESVGSAAERVSDARLQEAIDAGLINDFDHEAAGITVDGELEYSLDKTVDVTEFVRRTYVHGTPMAQAIQFQDPRSVGTLLTMLDNPADQPYWGNIAAVLGMIGGKEAAQPLMDFALVQRDQKQDWEGVRDITAALMGLGYLANRTGDPEVVEFLSAASSAPFWTGSNDSSKQLAVAAAIGLAFSGQPQALTALEFSSREFDTYESDDLIEELLELHQQIARTSVEEYYSASF